MLCNSPILLMVWPQVALPHTPSTPSPTHFLLPTPPTSCYKLHPLSALVECSEHVGSLCLVVEILILCRHVLHGFFVFDTTLEQLISHITEGRKEGRRREEGGEGRRGEEVKAKLLMSHMAIYLNGNHGRYSKCDYSAQLDSVHE